MESLWTPWRMAYILGEKPKGCILCLKPNEDRDQDNYLLYRGRHCYVLMNLFPYNPGHLMISPYTHTASLELLDGPTTVELAVLVKLSLEILRNGINPQGFNVGANIGKAAGAGIDEHFHMHVVPRWQGDNNFMPVLSDTKLIPELLGQTYEKLLAAGIADETDPD